MENDIYQNEQPAVNEKNLSSVKIKVRDIVLFACGIAAGILIMLVFPSIIPGAGTEFSEDLISDGKTALETVNSKLNTESGYGSSDADNGEFSENRNRFTEYISDSMTYDAGSEIGKLPLDSEESFVKYMLDNTNEGEDTLRKRWELHEIIKGYDLGELQGLTVEAFLKTPRHKFVRERNLARAYDDSWLPVGYGATITDPDVVAMMTTTLNVEPGMKVLEIGTGSGYQSAILSNLTNEVYSIEIIEPLFYETNEIYKELSAEYPSYSNIRRRLGDGYYGWIKYAPFDRIIVTCAIDHLPPPLLQQLTDDGIMVVPLGHPGKQYIMEIKKKVLENGDIDTQRRDVYNGMSVKFIPFTNEQGTSYSGE